MAERLKEVSVAGRGVADPGRVPWSGQAGR